MRLKRVMIAAPKSGSGKTTITCALLQAFKDMGQKVAAFKCGPDYIDPMFHQEVLGIPSKNLDTFFTGEEETKQLFLKNRTEEDIAVLEGVMGLFDGLGGVREEGSSYHLAKVTKTPILLVVDAKGMGRSVIPMIAGFLRYDAEHLIKGVLLNRMSKSYFDIVKPLIEEELSVEVVGYFPDHKQFHMESRYLGLKMPDELEGIREKLRTLSDELQKTVSMEKVMQIAESAEDIGTEDFVGKKAAEVSVRRTEDDRRPIIAVAKDEAFCFYYEDNLLLLQECGAQLQYFSPLHDRKLPEHCHGILLGGGYPELYAEELSHNIEMLKEIKAAMEKRMPVVAECGGFMYLHSAIKNQQDISYDMVGALSGRCYDTGKLVRFGYIALEEMQSNFLPEGEQILGHEFHYYDSEENGRDCLAIKPVTGRSYPCVRSGENYWLGFPHLYYPSNPAFAKRFVDKAKAYQERKEV